VEYKNKNYQTEKKIKISGASNEDNQNK